MYISFESQSGGKHGPLDDKLCDLRPVFNLGVLLSELGLVHQCAVQNLGAEGMMGLFFVPGRPRRGCWRGEQEPGCGVIANHPLHNHLPGFFCTRSSLTFPKDLTHRPPRRPRAPRGKSHLYVDLDSQVVWWEGREKGWPRTVSFANLSPQMALPLPKTKRSGRGEGCSPDSI